jgi:AcrR family transcriptional regulator
MSADSAIARRRAAARAEGNPSYVEKRRRMVDAATLLFNDKGYDATTLADVAHAVGVDRASIYYYVESKEELLREVVIGLGHGNLGTAQSLRVSDLDAPVRIRGFIESTLCTYFENYPQFFVFIHEDMSKVASLDDQWSRDLARQVREFQTTLESMLREGVEQGAFRADLDLQLVIRALWGMLNWTSRWYKPEKTHTARDVALVFSELFLHGLSAQCMPPTVEAREA